MLNSHALYDMDAPSEGFYTTTLPRLPEQPVRTFLPEQYLRCYAYPVLIFFHGRGSNEADVLKLAPKISKRNFIGLSLRASLIIDARGNDELAYSWLTGNQAEESIDELTSEAIEYLKRNYLINSKNVYLVGVNEGSQAAYQAAMQLGEKVAGVVALNGYMPRKQGKLPLIPWQNLRQQRILICQSSTTAPADELQMLRDHKLFYAAGMDVTYKKVRSQAALPRELLAEVNRWIIQQMQTRPAPSSINR